MVGHGAPFPKDSPAAQVTRSYRTEQLLSQRRREVGRTALAPHRDRPVYLRVEAFRQGIAPISRSWSHSFQGLHGVCYPTGLTQLLRFSYETLTSTGCGRNR
ncbi:MAG: hypothetical protein AVDCRST_MAG78-340 [uncultured Rubrobacteraceae bacterium]|uniref:Uncharacterized protein n=1 Tax=uncultured Rubrobacteraceae bacterium TaxID=349277 RepID=A0A6J4PHQ4_9ACTN|nr:MAG: hypothetical protein AVDCRST_MAG78-340 [uncultured Rubrobacteraceae bacterium]